jgi:hypothetical protein
VSARLTLVYSYYQNAGMLAEQYRVWSHYPESVKAQIAILVVDDATPMPSTPAVDVPRPSGLPDLSIYRVAVDVPWHQDGARNLGAREAVDGWLLLCDIDHVVPVRTLKWLLAKAQPECFYTFARVNAPTLLPMLDAHGQPKPAFNIYACTKATYWQMGGYDEALCGIYGTDGPVRHRLQQAARHVHLDRRPIIRYSRALIPDASTTAFERKGEANDRTRQALYAAGFKNRPVEAFMIVGFEWALVYHSVGLRQAVA